MKRGMIAWTLAAVAVLAGGLARPAASQEHARGGSFQIPESMRHEHEEIHGELERAARLPGRVGEAARELARVLHPHFAREEQIALPPLALLRPLSEGKWDPSMSGILPMTDSLRAELPAMLREHQAIGAAARRLEQVAREERNAEVERLARKLQLHARSEEEMFYPAAVLVGDLVRERSGSAAAAPRP